MLHSSYIEISKSALQNNIDFIRQEIGTSVKLSSVVKGNAYGHGIEQFGKLAQECGIDHFSVFSADEADRLLQTLEKPATIMIMGYVDNPELEWAIQHEIEFFIFELDRLLEASAIAKKLGKRAKVHLELETGMNRTGFDKTALEHAEAVLEGCREYVELQGVCTHYAGAESLQNHERVLRQLHAYEQQLQQLKEAGHTPIQRHTACSAAMVSYPQTRMDMVRVGIMQYGFWPSPETYTHYISQHNEKKDPLRRLINWKSHIMSLKSVPRGEYIGYGTTFQAPRDMVLAVVPVGYAWGYSRSLSNQGQVLIKGTRAGVVGTVNMNVMMVDVTNILDVQKNDEVVLLGMQGDESITVASFGELSTQLNYELLTRLPLNIPRYIID
ncbi:alanine racemase [Pontibacter anaerobius]|uniref:Alanine racemase n=1 Tax=Pontibacter anaerobius TaxID=2993940 RepID=A0ABT3RC79_9BACT|nr:alanine racemase [Pontibacter anaerobius]MCX2739219.1 alanine racemase [Pontibacter anaerobius]